MASTSDIYLKTQQVAQSLGVGVSTIKRWVDAGEIRARKTVGGHRLIELGEVMRFAQERGLPVEALEQWLPRDLTVVRGVDERLSEDLALALKRGRETDARALIHKVAAGGHDAVALGDHLLRPAMERIGHDWQTGGLDIYQEHRATRVVESVLIELIQKLSSGQGSHIPLAMGSSPEGDQYTLSGLLCELTLRELGWNVMNLGPNLPLGSLAKAIRVHHPRLVWITVHHLADTENFIREYGQFYTSATLTGAAVILGGPALVPEIRARLVAASFGDRLAHLAEFARRLQPAGASVGTHWKERPGSAS
jgi:excisionase family DNA binding protein